MKDKHNEFLKKIRTGMPKHSEKKLERKVVSWHTENTPSDLQAELEARFEELFGSLDEED